MEYGGSTWRTYNKAARSIGGSMESGSGKVQENIMKLIINATSQDHGGVYFPAYNVIVINVGGGHDPTLQLIFQIHKHIWNTMLDTEMMNEWRKGAFEILITSGFSPSEYADKYIDNKVWETLELDSEKLTMYKKWMDNNDTFVYACYPNYTDVKKYDNDIAAAKIAELELKYKSLSEDEKSAMLRKNYVRLMQDLYAKYKILEDADFYAEAYAEIGAYILAGSNSNISAGTGSKRWTLMIL